MYLILFTIIYCVVTQILNLNLKFALGIYLIGLSVGKGVLSKEIVDVFNFRKTSHLYEKFGFKDSLMELVSLILVFLNAYLIDYEPFTPFEFIWMFFLILIVYRFLFWGTTLTFKNFSIESSSSRK